MRPLNFIVLGIAAAVSLFLLWLWWYLGFSKVDAPADVLIPVAWWLVIGLVVYGIYRMEARRRQQMRTVYVSPTALFNCESGLVECTNTNKRIDMVESILQNMRYGMDFEDMPDPADFAYSYIIRTEDYKNADDWRGTVVKVDRSGNSKERSFSSRTSLATALL